MRIAVLSDIHANILALESIVRDIKSQNVDEIVFLGDLIMTGPRPCEVFELLIMLKPSIWIEGNTDDWLSEISEDYVPKNDPEELFKEMSLWAEDRLPKEAKSQLTGKNISESFPYNGIKITFCHGSPMSHSQPISIETELSEIQAIITRCKSDLIVCGHTHRRFALKVTITIIINFGAVSNPPEDDNCKDARYGIVQIDTHDKIGLIQRECKYDFTAFIKDMEALKYPGRERIRKRFGL